MATTMTQIAKDAKVSVALVSRFLREDPTLKISPESSKRILRSKEKLGGLRPRQPKRKRTRMIMIPVNQDFPMSWLDANLKNTEEFEYFRDVLGDRKFHITFSLFDHEKRAGFFEDIIKAGDKCDGMLIQTGIMNQQIADMFCHYQFPHVCRDFRAEQYQVNTIENNESVGVDQAVVHLNELGHRKIGFIGHKSSLHYPLMVSSLVRRGILFNESLRCVSPDRSKVEGETDDIAAVRKSFGEFLDAGSEATSFVCHDDIVVMGAVQAMQDRGLTPGRDISLVGYENLEVRGKLKTEKPFITTIDVPGDQIGRRAGELLLNQILHKQLNVVHVRVPTELIVRSTTGPVVGVNN